jgi:succinoglycan biosynthesis transport protein ExoP
MGRTGTDNYEVCPVSRTWDLLRQSEPAGVHPELADVPVDTVQIPPSSRIEVHTDPRGACADRFRLLRLRLQERWNAEKLKKILITSPLPHDGKSTTALNLATALAARGKRPVLLIGADLHHATLIEQLAISDRRGLGECLEDGLNPLSVIRRIEPLGWYLLPAGSARTNPTELLQGGAMTELMEQLSPHFEWLLIDSPPVSPLADALALKQRADASLLVVRAGRTPIQAVEQAVTLLGPKHILGIVLNGIEGLQRTYAKYYGAYSGDSSLTNGDHSSAKGSESPHTGRDVNGSSLLSQHRSPNVSDSAISRKERS